MSSEQFIPPFDATTLGLQSLAKMGAAAAHADDYVLQELLQVAAFDANTGAFGKAILAGRRTLVTVGASDTTPILVNPFRAIVGSRIAGNGTVVPPPPEGTGDAILTTAAEQNYRDTRSAVFAVADPTTGALGYQMPSQLFAPNATSFNRWDVVYATLYVDQLSTSAKVLVKAASGGTAIPTSAAATRITSVGTPPMALTGATPAIAVATGAAAATPLVPSIPTDDGVAGVFHFPLALILIPAGFTPGSMAIPSTAIQIIAPLTTLAEARGAATVGPMSESTGTAIATAALDGSGDTWGSTGARPTVALPASMKGEKRRLFLLDATPIAASAFPFGDTSIIDKSIDWRNRYIEWFVHAGPSNFRFASDPLAIGTTLLVPSTQLETYGTNVLTGMGQSFIDDGTTLLGSGHAGGVVLSLINSKLSVVAAGALIALYVDLTTGYLRLAYSGTPGTRLVMRLSPYGQFENL